MPQSLVATEAFRRLLLRSVILPVVVMGLLAGVLIWQIGRLRANARLVEHTDQIIARLHLLEKYQIDMETGLRGFLIAGSDEFLEPYASGAARMPELFAEIENMFVDQPAVVDQLAALREARSRWIDYAEAQVARRRVGSDWQERLKAGDGKEMMDDLRRRFDGITYTQVNVRGDRNARTERISFYTIFGAGGLAVLVGVLMSLMSRGQLRLLAANYEAALADARTLSDDLERRVDLRTRELSTANAKLDETNRELEAFAHSVSHDLRAPMRHIGGFANLLRASAGPRLSADDLENVETIRSTAVQAGRMVDDLLSFSRVGRTQLKSVPIDMNALIGECVKLVAPELRGRIVEWRIGSLAPTLGDPALLRMAFANLLSNAVKYTGSRERATIEVSCRVEADGPTYCVRDNGVGFDMAYVHKLFGVFQRLHRAEDFEGTGIGLANVRRIITRHGGTVWAEGVPDVGAAFFVRMPAMANDAAVAALGTQGTETP